LPGQITGVHTVGVPVTGRAGRGGDRHQVHRRRRGCGARRDAAWSGAPHRTGKLTERLA
jgi:hypothetical protein